MTYTPRQDRSTQNPYGHPGQPPADDPSHGHEPGGVVGPNRQNPTGPDDPTAGLTGDQRNAMTALDSMFEGYGLGSLAPKILDYVKQGYDISTIQYLLQQTDEWKQRFAGNEIRKANGENVLSVADYLATENSMRDFMKQAGLPAGFWQDNSDFAKWIGAGISADEVKTRAVDAMGFVNSTDPNTRAALQQYYGVDAGHIAAYFLDPEKAITLIQRQANAAQIGAAALDQHLTMLDQNRAEQFADQGVTADQARQGYGQIAGLLPDEQAIAHRFGQDYSQNDAEDEVFGGMASAARKRKQLNDSETALFSGSGGAGSDFYHPDYALSERTSGQF